MNRKEKEHNMALKYLVNNSHKIGISKKNISRISMEETLYKKGKKGIHIKLDIVFELRNNRIIIVEYKSNGNSKNKRKGKGQLEKGIAHYKHKGFATEGRLYTRDSLPFLTEHLKSVNYPIKKFRRKRK